MLKNIFLKLNLHTELFHVIHGNYSFAIKYFDILYFMHCSLCE